MAKEIGPREKAMRAERERRFAEAQKKSQAAQKSEPQEKKDA